MMMLAMYLWLSKINNNNNNAGRRGISTKMSPSNNQQKNSLYF